LPVSGDVNSSWAIRLSVASCSLRIPEAWAGIITWRSQPRMLIEPIRSAIVAIRSFSLSKLGFVSMAP
jgi:hypothetical protein